MGSTGRPRPHRVQVVREYDPGIEVKRMRLMHLVQRRPQRIDVSDQKVRTASAKLSVKKYLAPATVARRVRIGRIANSRGVGVRKLTPTYPARIPCRPPARPSEPEFLRRNCSPRRLRGAQWSVLNDGGRT
jgi:hypothetical protein